MSAKNKLLRLKTPADGFTLVEVLVAILIFSIGLLGVAGLLVSVIGRNQSSVYHSVAVSLANDMAERIRANSKAYSLTAADNKYTSALSTATLSPVSKDCQSVSATCSPDEIAAFDAAKWEALVQNILPRGKGIVCFDASDNASDGELKADGTIASTGCDAGGGSVVIKLLWDETRSGGRADGTSMTQLYVLVFQP